ncbi:hypothetical protein [Actinokineospora sp. NBRC 105648]|uniref:hypothetical protein n=1 Tax=Actinokineospora sp. NBRC 105648 TaxID=3032206 RepID=UPI0024A17E8F|nr:hypothetical protein [Actinokineospora sp. NBRC 105648]GLZ43508.1 hypothetical protein Acsp05_71320 [Actinokineospora sp. NBRC 105648]
MMHSSDLVRSVTEAAGLITRAANHSARRTEDRPLPTFIVSHIAGQISQVHIALAELAEGLLKGAGYLTTPTVTIPIDQAMSECIDGLRRLADRERRNANTAAALAETTHALSAMQQQHARTRN